MKRFAHSSDIFVRSCGFGRAGALFLILLAIVRGAGAVGIATYEIHYNDVPGPYLVDVWTVADNFINTGLAYNPIDHTLFCAHLDFSLQGESIEELRRADGQRAADPISVNPHTALPQGLTYHPSDRSLFVWGGDCGHPDKYVSHFAQDGTYLSDGFAMPGYPGMLEFDQTNGMIWSKECDDSIARLYALNGVVIDQFDTGIGGEGITRDPTDGTFWVLTNLTLYHIERAGNAAIILDSYPNPSHHYPPDIQLGYTVTGAAEGLVLDPSDGTLWFNADQHCHGEVPNGNRCWHVDPIQTHDRFVRFPGGVHWEYGVHDHTVINGSELTLEAGAAWGEYITAIVDLGSHTALSDQVTNPSGGAVTKLYRGGDTAPTTPPLVHITRSYYDATTENLGWGSTVPSAWSPEIPALRYLQVRLTLHANAATVPTTRLVLEDCIASSPFRGRTAVTFTLTRSAPVTLHVLDLEGRCIRRLPQATRSRGRHTVAWDGCDRRGHRVPAGAYVLRLIADQQVLHRGVIALGE